MDLSSLASLGKVAGLGGLAIGLVVLLVRADHRSGIHGARGTTRPDAPLCCHGSVWHWRAWNCRLACERVAGHQRHGWRGGRGRRAGHFRQHDHARAAGYQRTSRCRACGQAAVTTGARFVALFFGVGLAIAGLGEAVALNRHHCHRGARRYRSRGDIKNNTINQTIIQQDPAALAAVVKVLSDQNAATTEARITAEREASALAEKLKLRTEAMIGFLRTLGEQNVPPEKITAKLIEIANQAIATRQRLAPLEPDDPATKALVDQAKVELDKGHPDAASALLQRAEEAELASAAQARALAQQASAAADARQLRAAKARESRGDVALTQLHYGEAAGLFGSAASLLPAGSSADRGRLLSRQADALYRQGSEFGDNKALTDSIAIWKEISEQDYPRTKAPLDWAMSQNNLGNALATLGGRESGTARLEDAVAAYRAALEERTRDRVPLDWAKTQNNLGNALWTLGERESGTARLEEAVAAYRAALEERTRDRVPLDWATTQNNLGTALWTLGARESGTARLEEAVAAYRAALEERTRERVPLDWAMTQMNLGNALAGAGRAGERDGAAGGGGGSVSRGAGGEDARSGAARRGR